MSSSRTVLIAAIALLVGFVAGMFSSGLDSSPPSKESARFHELQDAYQDKNTQFFKLARERDNLIGQVRVLEQMVDTLNAEIDEINAAATAEEYREHFRLANITADLSDTRDRYPLYDIAVVRLNESGERELVPMQWGLLPSWWKPSKKTKSRKSFQRMTYNARSETIDTKPSYRHAFKRNRVLIPATQFYEHGFYFRLARSPLFAIAGLAEHWSDGTETVDSCTMVTTEANEMVGKVHPRKRMPVILDSEAACARWLNPELTQRGSLDELFVPYDDGLMDQIAEDAG
ncbi:SOS response-associated protein yoqW [Durusdinium trenchii]|uniref:SOS response-associated protein yoqW n=1 Tax=Durusdinium trenchii TaxID=1381693 RepID=A0ABP0NVL8_9DINO